MSGIEMGKKIFEKFKEKFPEFGKDAVSWKLNGTKTIIIKMKTNQHIWFNYEDDEDYILRVRKGV